MKRNFKLSSKKIISMILAATMVMTNLNTTFASTIDVLDEITIESESDESLITEEQEETEETDIGESVEDDSTDDTVKPNNDLILINPPEDFIKPDNQLPTINPPEDFIKPDNQLPTINPPEPENVIIKDGISDNNFVPVGTEIAFYGNGDGGLLFDKVNGKTKSGAVLATTKNEIEYGIASAEIVYKDGSAINDHVLPAGDDGAGFDFGLRNGIVRTFDVVTYQVDFSYNKEDESKGTIIMEAIAPEGDYIWDTEALEKLGYNVSANADHSEIKLTFPDFASGSGYSTKLPLYVGAQRNGDLFTPTFKIYEDGTTVESKNTLIPDTTKVSAKTYINILANDTIVAPSRAQEDGYALFHLGYELQMAPIPENNGTNKGIQAPLPTDVITFNIIDIEMNHTLYDKPYTTEQMNNKVYVYDYGLNNGIGELEGLTLTNTFMSKGKETKYFLPSSEALKLTTNNAASGRYIQDSGTMTVTKINSSTAFTKGDFKTRQANEFTVSFTKFSGFTENDLRNLRNSGIPFASGGVVLAALEKASFTPDTEYNINISATASSSYTINGKTFESVDNKDDKAIGYKPYRAGAKSYYTYISDYDVTGAYTWDDASKGVSRRPIGHIFTQCSYTGNRYDNVEKYKTHAQFTIFDPRAAVLDPIVHKSRPGPHAIIMEKGANPDDISYEKTYILAWHKIEYDLVYGVRDFRGINMDHTGSADTLIKDSNKNEVYMDEVEKEMLNLDGFEDDGKWQWFNNIEDALKYAEENEGWYACATRLITSREALLDYLGYEEGEVISYYTRLNSGYKILDNDFTKFVAKNNEAVITATNTRFYKASYDEVIKNKGNAPHDTIDWYRDVTDNKDFGYRKTYYDEVKKDYITHSVGQPGPATSMFLYTKDASITKKVADENEVDFTITPSSLVPGVDKALWWKLDAYTNDTTEVTPSNPFIVTDRVNVEYLELDYDTIYPQSDPSKGIELKTEKNGDIVTITWTFTQGEPGFFFEGFKYRTFINALTPSGHDFKESATVTYNNTTSPKAEASASVITDSNLLLYKELDKTIINSDDNITYTLNFKNRGEFVENYDLYDIFPYDGDKRGSEFTGYLKLKSITSNHADFEIEYTFDEGLRTSNLHNATFKSEADWEKEGKNIEDSTGIHIFFKEVQPNVLNTVTLNFDTIENSPSDVLYNDFIVKYELDNVIIPIVSNIVRSVVPGVTKAAALNEDSEFVDTLGVDPLSNFVYKITMFVPSVGYNQSVNDIKISDQLDEALQFVSGKLIDEEGNDVTEYFGTLTELNGLVTFEFDKNLNEVPGNRYSLILDVKLKSDYDLSSYVDEKVPNIATLTVDGKDTDSNEVDVYVPEIKKSIQNINEVNVGGILTVKPDDRFIYNLDFKIATFDGNDELTSVVISDQLEPVLKYIGAKLIDETGNDVTDEFGIITENNNLVKFTFTNLIEAQGKSFTLLITTEIPDGTDLSAYVNNKVPNTASININDSLTIESNEVVVYVEVPDPVDPTGPTNPIPKVTKEIGDIDEITFANNGNVTLGEAFVYKIGVAVPNYNENNYLTSLVISDQLEPVLKYISAKLVDSKGNDVTDYFGTLTENNNLVKYTFTKNLSETQGKSFTLFITVEIPEGTDLSSYMNNEVPNVASLKVNNGLTIKSNEVIAKVEVEPLNPIIPIPPIDPVKPIDPVIPVDPTNPTDPSDPSDPSEPTDPTDPSDPSDPTIGIDGDGVPFGTGNGSGVEDEEFFDTDDNGIPFGGNNGSKNNPKTGASDNNLALLFGFSLLAMVILNSRKKRLF